LRRFTAASRLSPTANTVSNDALLRLTEWLADRYRIDRELGAGGMATVFLAHDLRHDRDVAIKVLHPDLGAALGGERFLSEIRTTARLQHPHILPLLDSGSADGLLYYVMPLVTGETLRARLEREKQLPVDDAIHIAREVADALGYAHGLGVIHRDIKPENILLQGGHATVADFGIALAVQQAGGQRMTQTGLSLGTPQYMSPEQAMGERTIDARSDLYALAAVTYEMLAGEPPFTGPTVQAILARVMTEEPRALVAQRKAIPDHVDYAVMRGLEKLPADRWATAGEFAAALQGATATHGSTGATRLRGRSRASMGWNARLKDPLVLALACICLASVVFAAWVRGNAPRESPEIVRFTIPAAQNGRLSSIGTNTLAISPDGRTLVFVGEGIGQSQQLLTRPLDDVSPRVLPGTEGAYSPVVSPDGKWVAFVRANQVFKIAIDGTAPQLLAPVPGTFNGLTWSSTGDLIVSNNYSLWAIPQSGGQPRELVKADRAVGEMYLVTPVSIDDANAVLYASSKTNSISASHIAIASLKTGQHTILDLLGTDPLGVIDGVLVYATAGGVIMGAPFDYRSRKVTGAPVQLVNNVSNNTTTGFARAALARSGTLFYQSGTQASEVVAVGADGSEHVIIGESRPYAFPRLSPDGRRIAMSIDAPDRRDIWLYELSSQTMTRFTSEGAANDRPEWTSDGRRVLYHSDRDVRSSIWARPADLSTAATRLVGGGRLDVFEAVTSPDMRNVVYQIDTVGADIYYHGLNGDTTPHSVSNEIKAVETMPRVSPDGRWVAFTTDESGQDEVVVQPFPEPGGRVQVSANGGSEPVWSRDGRKLFYRGDGHLMAARLATGPSFAVAARDTLFADVYQGAPNPHANYDVMPDGTHFVFLKAAAAGSMTVVLNWSSAMRAQMHASATK
jgi:serine/threonine protein kinase/Tol biopolymer transport system component